MHPRQETLMASIATDALPVLALFAPAFTPSTFSRAQLRAVAAIRTTDRRTVTNLLRTPGHLAAGAPSRYHRLLSEVHWSGLRLAALRTRFLLRCYRPTGIVTLVGDDTVREHPGRKVYGKARRRDPIRSSHRYTASAGCTSTSGRGRTATSIFTLPTLPEPLRRTLLYALTPAA